MEAIARLKPKANVVALVGSTTNVVDGDAIRPGDVVRAGDGTSIEIQNTDAEGRLVLADVLHYAKRFKPQAVIDAATLTGAVVIALGNTTVGVMGNDQSVVDEVLAASKRGNEPSWQLPLFDEYKELLKSGVADLRNIGGAPPAPSRRAASSRTSPRECRGCIWTWRARRIRRRTSR